MRLWLSNQALGLKFKVQLRSPAQGGCYTSPKIFPPTGDIPTKATETWQQAEPSPQGVLFAWVFVWKSLWVVFCRVCVLRPVGGGMQASCLAGLQSVNTPCREPSQRDLEPESQARTVGSTDTKWTCFWELPQTVLCAGGLGLGGRGGVPWIGPVPVTSRRDQPLSGLSHPVCMMLWEDKNDHQGALHLAN